MNKKFAELLGIMVGDGCLSSRINKNVVYISGHKIDDLKYHRTTTTELFKDVFNKKIVCDQRACRRAFIKKGFTFWKNWHFLSTSKKCANHIQKIEIKFRKNEQTLFIRFSDKEIFRNLAQYLPIGKKYNKLEVPEEIINNREYFFAFMRGLADTDGSVIFSKQHRSYSYYPRIEIASKSRPFLDSLMRQLKKNGFYGSISHKDEKTHRLELPGSKNLNNWLKHIKFNNKKHLRRINAPDQNF